MKRLFIFGWVLSTGIGWDAKKSGIVSVPKKPILALGSDSKFRVDGRWSLKTIRKEAANWARQRKFVGYSVGYLETHDPEDKRAQAIIKFTEV